MPGRTAVLGSLTACEKADSAVQKVVWKQLGFGIQYRVFGAQMHTQSALAYVRNLLSRVISDAVYRGAGFGAREH